MGKIISFITILIFIDLLFITTGQICSSSDCSLSSVIFNSILNIGDITFTQLFTELIGSVLDKFSSVTGILSLTATGGVIIGAFFATREFRILLIPITLTLALIASDFVTITVRLIEINPVLAAFIMGPINIIYVFTVVEWFIGKD